MLDSDLPGFDGTKKPEAAAPIRYLLGGQSSQLMKERVIGVLLGRVV